MPEENTQSGWQPIETAPYAVSLQLAVIERGEVNALAFPCFRTERGWKNASTGAPVLVSPTHWRLW